MRGLHSCDVTAAAVGYGRGSKAEPYRNCACLTVSIIATLPLNLVSIGGNSE